MSGSKRYCQVEPSRSITLVTRSAWSYVRRIAEPSTSITAVRLPRWSCTIAWRVPAWSEMTVSPAPSYLYEVTRPNGLRCRTTRPSSS